MNRIAAAATMACLFLAGAAHARDAAPAGKYRLDLATTLRLAGAENLDVRIARERLAEARANQTSARMQFLPWLSPGAAYRHHDGKIQAVDGAVFDADKQSYNAGVALNAQIDIGDAVYKALAARQLVDAAELGVRAQLQDTLLAAAAGYYDVARAHAAAAIAVEAMRISEEYERQITRAAEAGIAGKGDELRVRVQTQRSALQLRQEREREKIAAARLVQTLRLEATVELEVEDADLVPLGPLQAGTGLEELIAQARRSRFEVEQSRALVASARESRDGALYGPLIPSVGVQVFAGGLGGGIGSDTGNFGDSEDYFAGLSWRIGPGGIGDVGRIRAADARLRQAALVEQKVIDEIARQVVEAHARVQSLADQVALSREAMTTAEDALALARAREQFDVAGVLEHIQAQQELMRTRSDYVAAVAELDKAQFALGRAVGSPLQ